MYCARRDPGGFRMSTLPGNRTNTKRRILRFGVFEFDAHSGELRKHGVKLRLQGRPLQVLQALIERPGEVVTREDLQRRLWPSNVFVDFEHGLNTAANRLRFALGDSAENPRYIETLPRVGYRFITPIDPVELSVSEDEPRPTARRGPSLATVVIASIVLIVLTIGMVIAFRRVSDAGFQFRQVTFRRGQIWG